LESRSEDNAEIELSLKELDASDTMIKEQAALDEDGKDSECSGQSEEEVEEEDAVRALSVITPI
jgi:hypothetical protein